MIPRAEAECGYLELAVAVQLAAATLAEIEAFASKKYGANALRIEQTAESKVVFSRQWLRRRGTFLCATDTMR